MIRKSFVAFVLAIVIMLDILPVTAFSGDTASYSPSALSTDETDVSAVTDIDGLTKLILAASASCDTETDISSFNIPLYLVDSLSHYIWYNIPEAFNIKGTSFSYNERTQLLETLELEFCSFADTKEEYELCHKAFLEAADRLLEGIEGNTKLSDVKKALLLHDRLAVNTQYDYDFYADTELKHSAYGALVEKIAVCQGYALAYMYLLDRVGIENSYCSSDSLNHSWNIVYIGGKPYHVDVTWDDVSWDSNERGVAGMVRHNNFLRSTKGLFEEEHTATDFDKSPVDTAYDNYFWRNSECEFQLIGNDIYYLDNTNAAVKKYGSDEALIDVSDIWMAGYPHYWLGNFARLSSDKTDLLYSKTDGIYRYSVKNKETEKIYSPELQGDMAIYGFTLDKGELICDINDGPPFSQLGMERLTQVRIPYEEKEASSKLNFKENDSMVVEDNFICMKPGVTVKQLLLQSPAESLVKAPDGKTVNDKTAMPSTGWTLILGGEKEIALVVRGDTDGDGEIASSDARLTLRASVGFKPFSSVSPYYKAADISRDKGITASDARHILRGSVGLEDTKSWTGK